MTTDLEVINAAARLDMELSRLRNLDAQHKKWQAETAQAAQELAAQQELVSSARADLASAVARWTIPSPA